MYLLMNCWVTFKMVWENMDHTLDECAGWTNVSAQLVA